MKKKTTLTQLTKIKSVVLFRISQNRESDVSIPKSV